MLRNNIFTQKETYSHLLLVDAEASQLFTKIKSVTCLVTMQLRQLNDLKH